MDLSFDGDTAMTANTCCKLVARLGPLLLLLIFSLPAHSQQLPDSTTSPADSPSAATPSADGALPASAIIELLREKPELMVDLKHQAAQQLQTQGIQIQEDSITDEMLLGKIVSDASVRANITLWLRARGYVTAADIEQAKAGQRDLEDDDNQSSLPSMPRTPTGSDSELSQLAASRGDTT